MFFIGFFKVISISFPASVHLLNFVLGCTKGVRLGFLILTVSLDYKNKLDTAH